MKELDDIMKLIEQLAGSQKEILTLVTRMRSVLNSHEQELNLSKRAINDLLIRVHILEQGIDDE